LNAKVLLVEDNPVNQEVAIAMLHDLCSQVEVAANGREAVAAFSDRNSGSAFDLIFMDCQMPEMDGFAAATEIRRLEASSTAPLRRIPVIALTADAMHGDRERCLAAGMDDYLSKPFSQEQLDAVMRRWLPASSAQETAAQIPVPPPHSGASGTDRRLLDVQMLDRIRALQRPGAPNILHKVITLYLEDAPKLLAALRDAVALGDCTAMQRTAHTCKSSSANLGALRLAGLCEEMEREARAGNCEQAQVRLGTIEDEYKKVVPALQMQFNAA
jgi:CheY-like chemotaxis protein